MPNGEIRRSGISIHAPRAGSDAYNRGRPYKHGKFQSTLPVRGATRGEIRMRQLLPISIHAPRAGSDPCTGHMSVWLSHFNPRSPCGERQWINVKDRPPKEISIHAPRAGSDGISSSSRNYYHNFNPRSPCGERLLKFESLFGFSNNSCMVIRFLAAPSSLL